MLTHLWDLIRTMNDDFLFGTFPISAWKKLSSELYMICLLTSNSKCLAMHTQTEACVCVFVAVKETQSGSFGGLNRADSDIILKFLLKLWVREVKNREINSGSKISMVWPYDICLKQKTLSSNIFITIMPKYPQ